jgi:2,4-didehydro-3-deoxy-L-rhamnonate hydrolase
MKLLRYGTVGEEKPGVLDAEGEIRALGQIVGDIDGRAISPAGLAELRALDLRTLPKVGGSPRLGPPVSGISKFICIGLNYLDHARETGAEPPVEPIIFSKATTAICGPNDDVMQPKNSTKLDWEVELGVVIGSVTRNIGKDEALNHVAGYCVVNDVSERAFQMQSQQWDKGKGCDTFGPIGPWLVTRDEIPDPQNLAMSLTVNGVRRQNGSTRTMIFDVASIVAYVSDYMTLLPGDVIATGTPPGVGMGQKPSPIWLQSGDTMELSIEGLGAQRQRVVPFTR